MNELKRVSTKYQGSRFWVDLRTEEGQQVLQKTAIREIEKERPLIHFLTDHLEEYGYLEANFWAKNGTRKNKAGELDLRFKRLESASVQIATEEEAEAEEKHKTQTKEAAEMGQEQNMTMLRGLLAQEQNGQLVAENSALRSKVEDLKDKVETLKEEKSDLKIEVKELNSELKSRSNLHAFGKGLGSVAKDLAPMVLGLGGGSLNGVPDFGENQTKIFEWLKSEEATEDASSVLLSIIQLASEKPEFGEEMVALVNKYSAEIKQ